MPRGGYQSRTHDPIPCLIWQPASRADGRSGSGLRSARCLTARPPVFIITSQVIDTRQGGRYDGFVVLME